MQRTLSIPENLRAKMLPFVRVARVKGIANLYGADEVNVAERLYGKIDRQIAQLIAKAAVDTHGTTGTGGELFSAHQVARDFVDAVRPLTALGKLATQRVPFATPLPFLSTRTAFGFVAERSPIAATAPGFGTSVNLKRKKCSGIVVVSKELIEDANGEDWLLREMATGVIDALDEFVFDATDADTGRPQAVNFGADPVYAGNSTGSVQILDNVLLNMAGDLIVAGSNLLNAAFVTTPANLMGLALFRHTNGETAYPGLSVTEGGLLAGIRVIPSAAHPAAGLTLVDGSEVLVADDSEAEIRLTDAAMIEQDTTPDGNNTLVSMFATDSIGIRCTLWINWQLRREFTSYCSTFDMSPAASSTA